MSTQTTSAAHLADLSAISLSALCLLHCLALPFLAAALPVAASLSEAEWLHKAFVLAALPVSGWVIFRERAARRATWFTPLALGGLALLLAAAFAEPLHDYETLLTVAGAALLAAAHVLRWRRLKSRSSHQKDLH
jgi:hypothetical protein